MRKILYTIIFSLVIVACGGYEPIPHLAKNIFQEPVLVKVSINEKDPQSGRYIEEELIKAVSNRLNLEVTQNAKIAKNYIIVTVYAVNTSVANKDDDGNVIRYSVNAAIKFAVEDRYGFWFKNIVTNEFVSVKAKSVLSENEKAKAEKIAISKAIDNFIVAVTQRAQKMKDEPVPHKEEKEDEKSLLSPSDSNTSIEVNDNFDSFDEIDDSQEALNEELSLAKSNKKSNKKETEKDEQKFYLIDPDDKNSDLVEIKL